MALGGAILVLECFKLGDCDSIFLALVSASSRVDVPVLRPLIGSLEAPLNSEKAG